jgi:3-oxoacyl-[acyl-carrier protein] reductase
MGQDLDKRVALVSGASRGIGRSIAIALAGAGASVAVNYRERRDEAVALVRSIESGGGRAIAAGADVSVARDVQAMMATIEAELGPVDILVNNAGIAPRRSLEEIGEADFDHAIAVNLKSAFLCTQAVLPHMRAQGWGRIVNISSVAGRAAQAASGISVMYNASKAGLEGLTRGYAARLAAAGVTVNAVAPGLIETDMGMPLIEAGAAAAIPVGRSGTGEEVAQVAMLLVRDGFITGQTIAVNGGTVLY